MRTLRLAPDINAFTPLPDHVERAIRRLPRKDNIPYSVYRRLWRLISNGATMAECYSMIPSKRPALDRIRRLIQEEIG